MVPTLYICTYLCKMMQCGSDSFYRSGILSSLTKFSSQMVCCKLWIYCCENVRGDHEPEGKRSTENLLRRTKYQPITEFIVLVGKLSSVQQVFCCTFVHCASCFILLMFVLFCSMSCQVSHLCDGKLHPHMLHLCLTVSSLCFSARSFRGERSSVSLIVIVHYHLYFYFFFGPSVSAGHFEHLCLCQTKPE